MCAYLSRSKNNTISTLHLLRGKKGGRIQSGWRVGEGGDDRMRGRQSEKTTIKARERGKETDTRRESKGGGRKRKQVINNLPGGYF